MIDSKTIKATLWEYADRIKKKNARNVVFPFGENGAMVKKILEEYYGIYDVLIVDNKYSKVNESIISIEELKEVYDESMNIFVAVEDEGLRQEIVKELLCFSKQESIIDSFVNLNGWENYNDFKIEALLPDINTYKVKHFNTEKIKVRIYNFTDNCWNTLMSIAEAFKEDDRIDLMILARKADDTSQVYCYLNEHGYRQMNIIDYSAEQDRPDIFFLCHSEDIYTKIPGLRKYCKLIIAAPSDLMRYRHDWNSFWNMFNHSLGRFEPDYFLFDEFLYNNIKEKGFNTDRIIKMGNAKYDTIYRITQKEIKLPKHWMKLKELDKVYLYGTDHGVHDMGITEDTSFDIYGKKVFEFFHKNPNMGLIFRPHPSLISELINLRVWTEEDLLFMQQYCNDSPNIVFDTSMNYDMALSVCDAILTESYCGITVEALPLNKPICMIYRKKQCKPYHLELEECNYRADSWDDIQEFMQMVNKGIDKKKQKRNDFFNRMALHFDGENGVRIKEFALRMYCEKEKNETRKFTDNV